MATEIDPRWAWQPYRPTQQEPWDLRKVGHLYRRAAFGASWPELHDALRDGPDKTIDALLRGGPGQEEFDRLMAPLAHSLADANNGSQLRAWWLYRMLYSPHPLLEKMTLFWHNHFATSNAKVNNARYMLGQYELMRRHGLGSFRSMLLEMSKDPAMMVWLDTNTSKKGKPNENYARELMELFSLGIGNYTEKDIREAARAFTGWEIVEGKARFNPKEHDDGEKTVLGQTGKWGADDIVRICLEQPSCPYFIVGKLFRFLISETMEPTRELLEPLATQFAKSDFDIGALVKTILRSNLFFSPQAYRARIKPPVDFALGTIHALEGRVGTTALAVALEGLGQNVFYPPSVKGWDGGPAWLNGQTLLFRQNLTLAMTSTEDPRFGRRTDPAALVRKYNKRSDEEIVDFFLVLFLQGDAPAESRERLLEYARDARRQRVPVYWTEQDAADQRVRSLCHLVLTLPEYQLS
ncbi:MAG: DUF1800 domain-containing protein [Gemmataceae bacterium]|nr:DUF1800 domain-containing protein [Gemmataceae bacterium]MDW8267408.1 DUF1800 domain-containing protein [Gemmataceae bacterium]